jgi:hypothetical protein
MLWCVLLRHSLGFILTAQTTSIGCKCMVKLCSRVLSHQAICLTPQHSWTSLWCEATFCPIAIWNPCRHMSKLIVVMLYMLHIPV